MENKYREIYNQLKEEYKCTLDCKDSQHYIDEFKASVRAKIKQIQEDLDKKKEDITKLAIEAYEKQCSQDEDPQKEEIKKKLLKNNKKSEVVVDPESFNGRIKGLVNNLDTIVATSSGMEQVVESFKNDPLNKLLMFKDGEFYFNPERKLRFALMGKLCWPIGWAKVQNKPDNSSVDGKDDQIINIHANSCYNYYSIDTTFMKDESVHVVLETNIIKTDGYLYFGIINDNLMNSKDNNCGCCTCKNYTYIRSTGYIIEDGKSVANPKLKYLNGSVNRIEIRAIGPEKIVYFRINEEDEQGPYPLPDTDKNYLLTSGSCNSANGYIKIISAIHMG